MKFPFQEKLDDDSFTKLKLLRKKIKNLGTACVAYSGGVDSTLIAAIAQEQLGSDSIAITGVSPSLAPHLLEEAREQAKWIGIKHKEIFTHEIKNPDYFKNPENRCFACKTELHNLLKKFTEEFEYSKVLDGINFDDLGDFRPGIEAAKLANVKSPLAELKINKSTIRKISKSLGFPWFDKPSQPCLASRFPYGENITTIKLSKVAKAENWLHINGFPKVRVRVQGLSAKIELPANRIQEICSEEKRTQLTNFFLSLGFTSISIDLEGLVSGKLNRDLKRSNDESL